MKVALKVEGPQRAGDSPAVAAQVIVPSDRVKVTLPRLDRMAAGLFIGLGRGLVVEHNQAMFQQGLAQGCFELRRYSVAVPLAPFDRQGGALPFQVVLAFQGEIGLQQGEKVLNLF